MEFLWESTETVSRAVATVVFRDSPADSSDDRWAYAAGRLCGYELVGPLHGSVDTTRRQSVEGTREYSENAVDTTHSSQAKLNYRSLAWAALTLDARPHRRLSHRQSNNVQMLF